MQGTRKTGVYILYIKVEPGYSSQNTVFSSHVSGNIPGY